MTDDHERFLAALFGKEKAGGQQAGQQPAPEAPGPEVEGTPPEPSAADADRRQEDTAAIEEVVAAVTLPENLPGWQAAAAQAQGLPPALAPRLQGDSEVAVHLDAGRLARSLGTGPGTTEQALLRQNQSKNADLIRSIHPATRHTPGEGEQ